MNLASSLKSRVGPVVARYWADAISCVVALSMTGCILLEELRLGAGTYAAHSDYWEHSGVLHALIANPWHPANPHLLSPVSSPRFGPLAVLNALVARAFGLDAVSGLKLAAVGNTLLFVIGIWLFFRVYFRDARAGAYGLIVMLGAWWEAWTFTSIYQPKVLLSVASYPWLAAFGVTLVGLALAARVLRARERHWLGLGALVLWAAVVFLTHQVTAMMALSALFLLALCEPEVTFQRRAWVAGTAVLGCLLAALWPYYSVWGLMAGGHADAGWVSRGVQAAVSGGTVVERHRFYRPNELIAALGLASLAVLFLPYFFLRRRRWFVGLGVLAMLGPFALNAFVPLPLGHRFILLAVFFLHVGVVWLLLALTPGSSEFPRLLDKRWLRPTCLAVVWGILLLFGYHNVVRTEREWAYFERYARRGESPLLRYARRVGEIAGERAVVMGDTLTLWPIPTFGPKVTALQHENPFVPDEEERDDASVVFFASATPEAERLRLIQRFRVTHVVTPREPRGSVAAFLANHAHRERLPAGYLLFTLNPELRTP